MPRESWVRPPVVPAEAPSKAFATWRYRVVAAVLLVVVAYVFVKLFLQFSDVTGGEDPGIGGIGVSRTAAQLVTAAR